MGFVLKRGPAKEGLPKVEDFYRDFRLIHRGRTHVLKVVSKQDGQVYALKVFSPRETHEAVQREYQAMQATRDAAIETDEELFGHCIPAVNSKRRLSSFIHEGRESWVFEMEYLDAVPLVTYYQEREEVNAEQWLEFFEHAFALLNLMHWRGYTHGTLTPHNIVVRRDSQGQLPIFEDLKYSYALLHFRATSLRLNKAGIILGDPLYTTPELIGYTPKNPDFVEWMENLDPHDLWDLAKMQDVYSLGVTLFNFLGRVVFSFLQLELAKVLEAAPAIFDAEKRAKETRARLLSVFSRSNLLRNFQAIGESSILSEYGLELVYPLYQGTVGGFRGRSLPTDELSEMAYEARK